MKRGKSFLLFLFLFLVTIFLGSCGNSSNSKDTYQIMFADYDGTVLYSSQIKAGEMPSYPLSEPTRKADDDYSYAFSEWWPTLEKVTEDKIYTAYYSRIDKREYTVTFKNYDGSVLETQTVKEGETPEYSSDDPTKPIEDDNKYVFSGWTPKIAPVTADVTFTAQFSNEDVKLYKISFYNYDNQIIKTIQVKEGQTPSFDGETPTKPNDANNKYTFKGWIPALKPVTGDANYIADFNTIELAYTLSLDLNGGTTSGKAPSPIKTDKITPDLLVYDLTKANYKFDGWSYKDKLIIDAEGKAVSNLDEIEFDSSVTLVAHYLEEAHVNLCFTAYNGANNSVLDTYLELPEVYGNASTSEFYKWNTKVELFIDLSSNGYTFDGWYENGKLLSNDSKFYYYLFENDVVIESRFILNKCKLDITANNEGFGEVMVNNYTTWGNDYETNHYYNEKVTVAAKSTKNIEFLGWYNIAGSLLTKDDYYTFSIDSYESLIAMWDYFKVEYIVPDSIKNDTNNPTYYSTTMDNIQLLPTTNAPYGLVFDCWNDGYFDITEIDTSSMYNILLEAKFKPAPGFEDIYVNEDKIVTGLRNKDAVNVVIPEGVLGIADEAFKVNGKLETISIPNTVKTIGASAFERCVSLKSITIPSSVTVINESTFKNCWNLTEIILPNTITSIGSFVFSNCWKLKFLVIPNSVQTIGENVLNETPIESLSIPFVGDKRHKESDNNQYPFGYIFGPKAVTGFPATTQQYYAEGSIATVKYYIPDKLTSVTITDCDYIQYGAFSSCKNIKSITISGNVKKIADYAFSNSKVESIVLPASLTEIGEGAFNACYELASIEFAGTVEQWNAVIKPDKWNLYFAAKEVVCSNGTVTIS